MLTAETHSNRKCSLRLDYGRGNCFLFINAIKECHLKANNFKKKFLLCLGNVAGKFFANNMKKSVSNGCVQNISVDFRTFDTSISIAMDTSLKNIM